MKLGSLFDGAGTFPFAGKQYGINPVWASEIEKFPIAVTEKRFPKMKHLGDITKINGAEIEPVDVITFGSPCQDLSVAGKQAGLSGERSGLFMEAVRIIKEMRGVTNGKYPRYAVWENVPGAFSSNDREDFRIVLEELCKIKDQTANVPRPSTRGGSHGKWQTSGLILADRYSIAWRVLDAQFWGVPQRRRRIFLVADFRGESAGQILFEREGLSRGFAESRKSWKGITTDTTYGSHPSGKCFGNRIKGNGNYTPIIALENHPADSRITIEEDGKIQTLTSRMGTGGGNVPMLLVGVDTYNQLLTGDKAKCLLAGHTDKDGVPCVLINLTQDPVPNSKVSPCVSTGNPKTGQANLAVCYNLDPISSNSMKSKNPNSGFTKTDKHRSLDTLSHSPTCNQGGTIICVATQQGGAEIAENLCPTVTAAAGMSGNNQPYIVYAIDRAAFNQGKNAQYNISVDDSGIAQTLVAKGPNAVCYLLDFYWVVRRVIPIECARLQGMPDWWCKDIPHSDSAEYKMWGNGMALPCVMYVMEGIALQLRKEMLSNLKVVV